MLHTILIVEDSTSLARTYEAYLKAENYSVEVVESGQEAITALNARPFDAVVLDVQLPDISGLDVLKHIQKSKIPAETVVITANGSINLAVDAMRAGAFDFIMKPFNAKRLQVTVSNAVKKRELGIELETLRDEVSPKIINGMICHSPAMRAVYRTIQNTAKSNATVFITGESGAGKEVCAKTLHELSPRAKAELVTLNCAAIPKDLLESEIFGHAKGAFTGATSVREGAAMRADGGTLFLDEICEMDISLQAKLLRFLQTRCVQRLGEDHVRDSDVRFVCATNRDPVEEVRAGRFREDLFYRLFVIPLELPPLRGRLEDIIPLAELFLARAADEEKKKFSGFSVSAKEVMVNYNWPGNVRQLENVVRNAVVLNDGGLIEAEMLSIHAFAKIAERIAGTGSNFQNLQATATAMRAVYSGIDSNRIEPLEVTIKDAIKKAIAACDGSIPRAADLLDVSPSTIYRRIENWDTKEDNVA